MNPSLVLGGLKSWLPLPARSYVGTGGTTSARYCYSVWLRHLELIHRAGLPTSAERLVELGPGDSIGTGLAALLTGTREYIALDVVEHADTAGDLRIFDELLAFVRKRAPIPDAVEFPRLHPRLDNYGFPGVLSEARIGQSLTDERVAAIWSAIPRSRAGVVGDPIQYVCPWSASSVEPGSADMVFSQGALQDMEHTHTQDALGVTLDATARWLRPGGVTSHQIDFSCPAGDTWNHHWEFSDAAWRVVLGRRPYYFNRAPLSTYLELFAAKGFRVAAVHPVSTTSALPHDRLAKRFRSLPASDYSTRAAFIIAVRV